MSASEEAMKLEFEAANDNPCKRCIAAGQPTNFASPRKCAFNTGAFSPDNWNCETMNALRPQYDDKQIGCGAPCSTTLWNEDQNACLVSTGEGTYILLSWYKNRGRTEGAWSFYGESAPELLTLELAEALLSGSGAQQPGAGS